mmetsp:Transcript_30628/g.42777  ORF Transcript_30628/g.42777 Transcript_30628/m.42777 type:complete len:290 (-) Transcript_30628:144-1013(-)
METKKTPPPVLKLLSSADYTVPGEYVADTRDYEDHTFSGIMFNIVAKKHLPVKYVEIMAIWVRGQLGRMQVFIAKDSYRDKYTQPSEWTRIHCDVHDPSVSTLSPLKLSPSIKLKPGEAIGVYVHSSRFGDQAIVYNNQHGVETHSDDFLKILPGMAHTSSQAFNPVSPWGHTSWRRRREFVGRLSYGAKFLLWNNKNHEFFPEAFRQAVASALSVRNTPKGKTTSCPILPCSVIKYIFNFCPWHWFEGVPQEADDKKHSKLYRLGQGLARKLSGIRDELDQHKRCILS